MADEWPRESIASLIESGAITGHKDGNFGSLYPRVEEFGSHGVPFLTARSLSDGVIDIEGAPRLADDRADKLRFGFVQADDVLLSHNATVGRVAIVPKHRGRLLVGTSLTFFRVDPSKIFPRYLAAYFAGIDFQRQLAAVMSHTTRNQVPITAQRHLYIVVPPLRDQQAIACILGALDDKIELNRRMNRTLEAMARAIFKSWFVDFDPVRAKAEGGRMKDENVCRLKPEIATLFPEAFEESELGEIPEGWKVSTLGTIGQEIRDAIGAEDIEAGTPYIALEHMPKRCISLDAWDAAEDIASGKLRFQTGDILFGKLRPYFKKVGPAPVDGVCSTDIVVARSNAACWYGVLLGHMISDEFVAHTDRGSTGTKMPRTNWRDMSAYRIALPPETVAERFSTLAREFVDRIRASNAESRTLASLRDALLPKLISGELRVPDAERIAGRCV